MNDLLVTLETMNSPQLALALVVIAGYGLALGRLLEGRARLWSAVVAMGAAAGFVSQAADWVPAVMLIALVFGLVAVLIALSWTVTAFVGLSHRMPQANRGRSTEAALAELVAAPVLATQTRAPAGQTTF